MKPLPVGISDFAKLRRKECFYVDKTRLISDFFRTGSFFTLFTRPRRFGKSLNLSMFRYFLEIGADPALFQGLQIMEDLEIVEKHMGRYPVIHLSFKDVTGESFDAARNALATAFGEEASRFFFLLESPFLSSYDIQDYKKLIRRAEDVSGAPFYDISDEVLMGGIRVLSKLLHKHYGAPCVVLLDEYDVPLDRAYTFGYDHQMLPLIRGMISGGLKDNEHVDYGMVVGCLRTKKDSIFTGINLSVNTVLNVRMSEHFGFTKAEVQSILKEYDLVGNQDAFRQKYEGYYYGKKYIYNPWDVLCAANSLANGGEKTLESFWADSGSNDILKQMLNFAHSSLCRGKIQALLDGKTIRFAVNEKLTYPQLCENLSNLWTTMLMAGFLTPVGEIWQETGEIEAGIPNGELQDLFEKQVVIWGTQEALKDEKILARFCSAAEKEDAVLMEEILGGVLKIGRASCRERV